MLLKQVLDKGKYKKNDQSAKTPKIRQGRVMVLCTELLFNEIYLSINVRDDISYSFRVMSRIKFKVYK
jgi:hypothetical protein